MEGHSSGIEMSARASTGAPRGRFDLPKLGRDSTAHLTAIDRLRASILSGECLPGERLIQEQLAEKYGLSRIPVREALRALEAEGLVVHGPGSGYSVAKIDAETLHSIQRVRQLLEAEAVRQAAAGNRLGPELADEMEAILQNLERVRVNEFITVASLTRTFHFKLFEACGDAVILRILRNLWDSTDSWRTIYYRLVFAADAEHRKRVFTTQRLLVAEIVKGDAERAIQILDALRDRGIASVEAAVQGHKNETQWQAHLMLRALQT